MDSIAHGVAESWTQLSGCRSLASSDGGQQPCCVCAHVGRACAQDRASKAECTADPGALVGPPLHRHGEAHSEAVGLWVHRVWGRRSLVSRPALCPSRTAGCPQRLPQPHTVSAQLAALWTAACAGRTGPVSWALGAGATAESTHGPWGPAAPAHPAHVEAIPRNTHMGPGPRAPSLHVLREELHVSSHCPSSPHPVPSRGARQRLSGSAL